MNNSNRGGMDIEGSYQNEGNDMFAQNAKPKKNNFFDNFSNQNGNGSSHQGSTNTFKMNFSNH